MAPIPSSTGTIRSSTDESFNVAGDAVTVSFDAGSDTDRFLVASLIWYNGVAVTVSAPTYNGVTMTQFGAATSQGSGRKQSFYLVAPTTGTNNFVVDPSAGAVGAQPVIIELMCYSGVDQVTPFTDYVTNVGADASGQLDSTLTLTGSSGGLLWTSHSVQAAGVTSGAPTNFTERLDNIIDSGSSDIGSVAGEASDAASVASSVAWTGPFAINFMAHGARLAPVSVGPTIDTQPTAQTARLHGEPTTTATFTVAATTSGGALSYDWELETSVGGGVYTDLSDGSGATWSGQASASAVGTFTATTLSGRRVRCNVTDSNGTVTTNAVTLTVLNGPVLSASSGTTNGSGVSTLTITSDDPLTTNGEVYRVTIVAGSVTKRTYLRAT